MKNILLVFLGGGAGSVVRYMMSRYLHSGADGIPYGTFVANILGSLIIGVLLGWTARNAVLSPQGSLLLATGFCGGMTTFSTFAYENHVFLRAGDFISFFSYAVGSFALGVLAVFCGMWLAK